MINSIFNFNYKQNVHDFAKQQIQFYYLFSDKNKLLDQILENPKFYSYLDATIKIQKTFKKCFYFDIQYKKAKEFALKEISKI